MILNQLKNHQNDNSLSYESDRTGFLSPEVFDVCVPLTSEYIQNQYEVHFWIGYISIGLASLLFAWFNASYVWCIFDAVYEKWPMTYYSASIENSCFKEVLIPNTQPNTTLIGMHKK